MTALTLASTDRDRVYSSRLGRLLRRFERLADRLEQSVGPAPEFTTVSDAVSRIGIGEKALRGAVNRGEVPVYELGTKAGGRRRVRLDEVREWALSTRVDPKANARAAGDRVAKRLAHRRSKT